MKLIPTEDILEVVGCDIDQRPTAPGIDGLQEHIRGIVRTPGVLTITFAPEAVETVEAFAAAERVCCTGITWDVQHEPETTLKISTNDTALDALQQIINTTHIEQVR